MTKGTCLKRFVNKGLNKVPACVLILSSMRVYVISILNFYIKQSLKSCDVFFSALITLLLVVRLHANKKHSPRLPKT